MEEPEIVGYQRRRTKPAYASPLRVWIGRPGRSRPDWAQRLRKSYVAVLTRCGTPGRWAGDKGRRGWMPSCRFASAKLLALLLFLHALAGAQAPALTETQIKAGFLFNFTKFV